MQGNNLDNPTSVSGNEDMSTLPLFSRVDRYMHTISLAKEKDHHERKKSLGISPVIGG